MTGRQDLFQHAMNQGHSAAWDQLWDRAAAFYRQALDEFPDHPQALSSLGLALYELKDYDESLRVYQRAARTNPSDPIPVEKLAQLFERSGKLEQACQAALQVAELYLKNRDATKAIDNWIRVLCLNPENIPARARLALVYERMGEKEKSVTEYLALASLFQSAGDMEKAMRSVKQALQIAPDSRDAAYALTLLRDYKTLPKPTRPHGGTAPLRMAQVRQLEAPKADEMAERVNVDPAALARQHALNLLANMLFDAGDEVMLEEAPERRGLSALMRSSGPAAARQVDRPRITLHLSQVVDLQTQGEADQAAEELERAIEAGFHHPAGYFDLGYLRFKQDDMEVALRHLQLAVNHPDFALGARLLMGEALCALSRTKEAAIEYLEALRLADALLVGPAFADDLSQLYEPLIEGQRQAEDTETHARLCENVRSLLMRPDWQDHLARARQQLPVRQDGIPPTPLAELLIEARSSQVVAALAAVGELAEAGQVRTAMEETFYALDDAPTYLPLHISMGELLLKQDRLAEAIAKFSVVARSYGVRGESQRAVELYRRMIDLAPMDLNARSCLIEHLIARQCIDEAITEYLSLAEVYYSLADLEMSRKTYLEGLRLAQQSKVERSRRVEILHRIADLDLQSLDWRQAQRIFEQIRTLQPDDRTARLHLIQLNLRLGQEPQALAELDNFLLYLSGAGQRAAALSFVEDLWKENPDRIQIRRRLAVLLAQSGKVSNAIEHLDAIGEALLEAGDRAGAAEVVQAILSLNPPTKADYQLLLAQLRS